MNESIKKEKGSFDIEPMYTEMGGETVDDVEMAHEMALIEDEYKKKIGGFFPRMKSTKNLGERIAEERFEEEIKIDDPSIPQEIKDRAHELRAYYDSAKDDGLINFLGIKRVDFGGGNEMYRISGEIARHDHDKFNMEKREYIFKTLNGKIEVQKILSIDADGKIQKDENPEQLFEFGKRKIDFYKNLYKDNK